MRTLMSPMPDAYDIWIFIRIACPYQTAAVNRKAFYDVLASYL